MVKGFFLKIWFINWFCIAFSGQMEIVCPNREHFLQNFKKSGFPLKIGSIEHL